MTCLSIYLNIYLNNFALTFSNGISGVQSVVFSSSMVLCWMPLSLRSLVGDIGRDAGVDGVFGELRALIASSSGQILFTLMLKSIFNTIK